MTAEVAVLNKSAIALAADSAVTITRAGRTEKTYNVNKLFTLSKHHPVGVMIYDSAVLMGVPWETILKLYRRQLGTKSFPTITDYANDLMKFLQTSPLLFPPKKQRQVFEDGVGLVFESIRDRIVKRVKDKTPGGAKISIAEIEQIISEEISDEHDRVMESDRVDGFTAAFTTSLMKTYRQTFLQVKKNVFPNFKFSRENSRKLSVIAKEIFVRDSPFGETGVVVAGFGDQQVFPWVYTFSAMAVLNGRLIHRKEEARSYTEADDDAGMFHEHAAVIAFAQTDVVKTFVEGVDPRFMEIVYMQLDELLKRYPSLVASKIGITDPKKQKKIAQQLSTHNDQAIQHILDEFQGFIKRRHSEPLLDVVSVVPKDELADIASALVELTSIKRKMSRGLETVGGPIDVAVISKGDGFIWIRRKHYFDKTLNLQFQANYAGEIRDAKDNENRKK